MLLKCLLTAETPQQHQISADQYSNDPSVHARNALRIFHHGTTCEWCVLKFYSSLPGTVRVLDDTRIYVLFNSLSEASSPPDAGR